MKILFLVFLAPMGWAIEVEFSRGLSLTPRGACTEVKIQDPRNPEVLLQRFFLRPRQLPEGICPGDLEELGIPVRNLDLNSSTQIYPLVRLGEVHRIHSFPSREWVQHPMVQERMQSGKIELGEPEKKAAAELVFQVQKTVLPRICIPEWREPHPLGYVEWIRLYGLLVGRPALAEFVFSGIRRRYMELRDSRTGASEVRVLLNGPYRGKWPLPGQETYFGTLLRDAGAEYVFADQKEASLDHEIHEVVHRSRDAEVWLHPSGFSCEQMIQEHPEISAIQAVASGNLFRHDRQDGPTGRGWYEQGLASPDEVLADVIKILDGKDASVLIWYRRVDR